MTSYSDINTYQRCPKKYYYASVLNLQPVKRSVALHDGINAHEMLKTYFLALQWGLDATGAWDAVSEYAQSLYVVQKSISFESELEEFGVRITEALGWIKRYCDQYAEEWEILHVEETFTIELERYVITFTPDLVVRDRNGAVWIIDHKTTSAVPEGGIPFGDMQALLYYTGVKSLYPETAGFIFNRIRKKTPSVPRLTKTGDKRVANLAKIDTTYEVLRDFLQDEAPDLLDDVQHQLRLAQLRDRPERWFWTETVYTNEATEEAILDDVVFVMSVMNESEAMEYYPRNLREDRGYLSCSGCAYQSLCSSELRGFPIEGLIELNYEQRPEKNPYEEASNA